MHLAVVTPPAAEALSLAEAKLHVRVEHDEEDDYIEALIVAARVYVEGLSRRSTTSRVLALVLDAWPARRTLPLWRPPVASVTSVVWMDADGESQTLPSADYTLVSDGTIALVAGASWPTDELYTDMGAITVTYTAGHADAADVPVPYVQAMRLLVGHWYEHREAAGARPPEAMALAVEALCMMDRAY